MHISEDTSLFIGLTTLPLGKGKDFFNYEITNFFNNFKNKCTKNGLKTSKEGDDPFDKFYYRPKAYTLFGNFDLAVLSLVDDFNLGTQTFHPYSSLFVDPSNPKEHSENFSYQVFTGPGVKQFSSIRDLNLLDKGAKTFLKERDEKNTEGYPFIGITALKLNNSLLVGSGGKLFELVVEAINHVIRTYKSTHNCENRLEYILTESYSWHEFTLVFFSYSFKSMTDIILRLRELDLNQLMSFARKETEFKVDYLKKQFSARMLSDDELQLIKEEIAWREKFISEGLAAFKEDFETNSLLAKAIKADAQATAGKPGNEVEKCDVGTAHIFISTHSNFGYDFDLLDRSHKELKEKCGISFEDINREFLLFSRWYTKPGHLESSISLFDDAEKKMKGEAVPHAAPSPSAEAKKAAGKISEKLPLHVVIGAGDYLMPDSYETLEHVIAVHRFLVLNETEAPTLTTNDKLRMHIRKISCIPYIKYDNHGELFSKLNKEGYTPVDGRHFYMHDFLRRQSFSLGDISTLRMNLVKLRCSKVLREKVLNMLVNFNDCIADPVLYTYFIELRPYVLTIQNLINHKYQRTGKEENLGPEDQGYADRTLDKIHEDLDAMVEQFDRAFKNRFHQSYRMSEITDFNMELNGGIQQIVSGLDAAYKTLTRNMCEDDSASFVYVAGNTDVVSDMFTMHLNYFHVFQPETFVAVAVKEAYNMTLERKFIVATIMKKEFETLNDFKKELADYRGEDEYDSRVRIKKRLLNLPKLAKSNHINALKFQMLFKYIDKQMVDYILADRVVFEYGYNNDRKLYNYWVWNFAAQLSTQYNKDGTFNEDCFIRLMIRMSFVFRNTRIEKKKYIMDDFWKGQRFTPPNNALSGLWLQHFDDINDFVDILLEDNSFKQVFNFACTHSGSIIEGDAVPEYTFQKLIEQNRSDQVSSMLNKLCSEFIMNCDDLFGKESLPDFSPELVYLQYRTRAVSYLKKKAIKILKEGRIFSYNYKKGANFEGYRNIYLLALFNAFMQLIKDENKDVKNNMTVLYRVPETGAIIPAGTGPDDLQYAPLSFDPLGGIYSMTTDARRNYFKYRASFIKSLYDFSLKQKVQLFNFSLASVSPAQHFPKGKTLHGAPTNGKSATTKSVKRKTLKKSK